MEQEEGHGEAGDPPPPPSWRQRLSPSTLYHNTKSHLLSIHYYNLHTLLTSPLSEISGSLGDLGTLLPLLIALTNTASISLPSTLVFSGLANILTGLIFGIPLPVQPMKAIAAIALSRHLTQPEVMSAGIFVGGCVGLLSLSGLLPYFTAIIPIPIIKGIQIGTGLSLILTSTSLFPPNPLQHLLFALAFLALLATHIISRLPYTLILLTLVLLYELVTPSANPTTKPPFTLWHPHPSLPSPEDFRTGTLTAGLGQLPLTTLNSIIAVAHLAHTLFPEPQPQALKLSPHSHSHPDSHSRPNSPSPATPPPPSTTALALSLSLINLTGPFLGAMPVCHGSGGLAAQYRFGARSGSSIIILGSSKLLLGLFASELARRACERFPGALLAVLMVAAGGELVAVGEELNRGVGGERGLGGDEGVEWERREGKRRWAVCFMTVAGILAFRNDAVGFAGGVLCHASFWVGDWWERRGEGGVRLGEEAGGDEMERGSS